MLVDRRLLRLRGVLEEVNAVRGREDIGAAEFAAEEGVEGRFAGLDLAHHHEEKRLAQARVQPLERLDGLRRRLEIMRQRREGVKRRAELRPVWR